ncbi:MAG: 4,5-dihydroxyphthalate decarboxylase [Alphaproteobacteria bacterium MarineAlpha11_Bin1]|nr:MAG: 4,5-dihydroxyphthalate decarboxylase [Alphaproteobacteria bacterium MarineAlpha11_Bin1]|tara:strand:+ start:56 stop:1048 length:993 start_codon:yes stop_codon:yes gene_type:complete
MSAKLKLTLACGDYEIVKSLKDGSIAPDGVELNVLTDMDSSSRHWRMIRNEEFDVCELSGSSYLMAKDRGQGFSAIPVFLHRRFRHGFIFVNTAKDITKPADLNGRRVGIKTYQATAVLYLRGLLADEYGVDLTSIEWITELEEEIPFDAPKGIRINNAPSGSDISEMLAEGEIDAVIHPDIIPPILRGDKRVDRLFKDYRTEEEAYYKRTGIFPIMHATAIRDTVLKEHPWVANNLAQAFEKAKQAAYRRMSNPRIVPLAWFLDEWDAQRELLGTDPWEYGLTFPNRKNLDTLIAYSKSGGLITNLSSVDDFYMDVMLESRGRGEWTSG